VTDTPLIDLVLDQADADQTLSEQAKMLVLAALDGGESLSSALAAPTNAPVRSPSPTTDDPAQPVGAYLTAIEVEGFRGIGTPAKLSLQPGPGLTIVTGRNGSGKSSFAEGLEFALTGESYRWREKPALWSSNWRNLHQPSPCSIKITLAVEDIGSTTVGVDWAGGAGLTECNTWTQRAGEKRQAGVSSLGWDKAIELYRPILSYEEMSGLLHAGPSRLYDALARILGLDQITDAGTRLTEALKTAQEPDRKAKEVTRQLKESLGALEDGRAAVASTELSRRKPDVGAIESLATGTGAQPTNTLGQLRTLAQIVLPSQSTVEDLVESLRQAIQAVADHGEVSVELAERRSALLTQAVELHSQHGDMPCPVCEQGVLNADWQDRVAAELARDNTQLAELREARTELGRRRGALRALINQVRPMAAPENINLVKLPRAEQARERLANVPDSDSALASHVAQQFPELFEAVTDLRSETVEIIGQMEDKWAPQARQLAMWVELKRQVEAQADTVKSLNDATQWIKANAVDLRNQRLEPLAARSREIWASLRQESNVDLGAITLESQGPRRHVKVGAEVDGEQAGALGVMSQGELHALALALFLPRATAPSSPFRFVVLDDPIQAMDPAKIDAFAHVLVDISQHRQVVVFSHDDRLADVVRRMAVSGTRILEITRGFNSAVGVRKCLSPADRYVEDAKALARDSRVPADIHTRVLPGLCRMAVEAVARDAFYARKFAAGVGRIAVEQEWTNNVTTRQRVTLALNEDITKWHNRKPWRKTILEICGRPGRCSSRPTKDRR
jgi:DNA repair exonuclease SbcCD ATPase subunit